MVSVRQLDIILEMAKSVVTGGDTMAEKRAGNFINAAILNDVSNSNRMRNTRQVSIFLLLSLLLGLLLSCAGSTA